MAQILALSTYNLFFHCPLSDQMPAIGPILRAFRYSPHHPTACIYQQILLTDLGLHRVSPR